MNHFEYLLSCIFGYISGFFCSILTRKLVDLTSYPSSIIKIAIRCRWQLITKENVEVYLKTIKQKDKLQKLFDEFGYEYKVLETAKYESLGKARSITLVCK
jgi:hypothetical protein